LPLPEKRYINGKESYTIRKMIKKPWGVIGKNEDIEKQ
jgi:hypothetical protein